MSTNLFHLPRNGHQRRRPRKACLNGKPPARCLSQMPTSSPTLLARHGHQLHRMCRMLAQVSLRSTQRSRSLHQDDSHMGVLIARLSLVQPRQRPLKMRRTRRCDDLRSTRRARALLAFVLTSTPRHRHRPDVRATHHAPRVLMYQRYQMRPISCPQWCPLSPAASLHLLPRWVILPATVTVTVLVLPLGQAPQPQF